MQKHQILQSRGKTFSFISYTSKKTDSKQIPTLQKSWYWNPGLLTFPVP